jgi:iron complex outermembrane receptor protein
VGAVGQTLLSGRHVVTARGAYMQQRHGHRFGEVSERDRHEALFGEVTVRTSAGRHLLVGGLAVERDTYRALDLPQFSYTFTAPGIFVQDDVALANWLSVSASARFDHHSEYGNFVSPRIAALVRSGSWSSRLSAGTGFYGPSPLTEETEAAGLSRLTIPTRLEAARGRTLSFDLSRTAGPGAYTVTLFRSRVKHPLTVDRENGLVLTNATEPAISKGVELLMTLRQAPWGLTGSYTFVDSTEVDDGRRLQTPLTPRHSAGVVGMWDREGEGRVGIELYYTGRQRLEDNPFLDESRHYLIVGLLVEKRISQFRVFLNGENLTGVRQTRWSPIVRNTRGGDGRWTVDAWAPLEGRSINGGFRFAF